MQCEVLRSFPGEGDRVYRPGERVFIDDWKNGQRLVDQKYLRVVSLKRHDPEPVKEPVVVPRKKIKRVKRTPFSEE